MTTTTWSAPLLADRTLTDLVVRGIRERIMLGEMVSGQRLTEAQLASSFEVSRSTIREALRRLEAERLVETISHRGSRVARLSTADAVEICELRAMIESYCLREQTRPISDELRSHLSGIVEEMRLLTFPNDASRFIDLDQQFHRSLVRAAGLRHAYQVWAGINSLLGILVTLSIRYLPLDGETIANRHQVIIDIVSATAASDRDVTEVAQSHYLTLAHALGEIDANARTEGPKESANDRSHTS